MMDKIETAPVEELEAIASKGIVEDKFGTPEEIADQMIQRILDGEAPDAVLQEVMGPIGDLISEIGQEDDFDLSDYIEDVETELS